MNKNLLRCWVWLIGGLLLTASGWSQERDALSWMPAVNELGAAVNTQSAAPAVSGVQETNDNLQGIGASSIDWLSKQIQMPTGDIQSAGMSWFGDDSSNRSMIKTAATLVLIVSLFLLAVFILRMNRKSGRGALPGDVVALLGQTQLAPTQRLQLIRLASKILLVSTTQQGSQTLGEVTDPEEVFRIESICRDGKWPGFSQTIRQKAERHAQRRQTTSTAEPSGGAAAGVGRTLLEA